MPEILVQTADGSVERPNGEVLYFSADRLVRDIVLGDCCLVCGASPKDVEFNDEHVIPRWILRKFDLYDRTIGLPNGSTIPYRQYTIPCCASCNSRLNDSYEKPVRELLEAGFQAVARHVREEGPWLLFSWLALLFVKTHLKDWRLRFDSDRRAGDLRMIGNAFAGRLGDLHHLHCVARSVLVGSEVQTGALGTFMCFAADLTFPAESFDYGDVFTARSVLLRYGDVGLVAALDDSCAAVSLLSTLFQRLRAPLNPLQLREVLGQVSYVVANLQERPVLGSAFDNDRHQLWGRHPSRVILKEPPEIPLGEMMVHCLSSALAHDPDRERIVDLLRQQRFTFLFGPDGQQIRAGASASWITRSKNAKDI